MPRTNDAERAADAAAFDAWLAANNLGAHMKAKFNQKGFNSLDDLKQAKSSDDYRNTLFAGQLDIGDDDFLAFAAAMNTIAASAALEDVAAVKPYMAMYDGDDVENELKKTTVEDYIDRQSRRPMPTPARDVKQFTKTLYNTFKSRPDARIKLKAALRAMYGFDEKAIRLLNLFELAGVDADVNVDERGCVMIAIFMNKGALLKLNSLLS